MTDPTARSSEDAGRPDDGGDFVSLYRRFRPGKLAEVRGQPHVVRALQGAVRDGRVAHAYLFSGPRGTGKTSTARILARALNCAAPVDGEPCGVCPSCVEIARGSSFDVHELDAASNNGVDAMRELIAHAALATPGRWKVYIVDEVHMLSNAAANALLKTLEEPPGHVVFVLATTDPQKVPATIRSRTQHLEFGLIGADTLDGLLHDVSTAAGLELADDDIAVAVRKGRGSARDALSALDQVVASGSAEALRPDIVGLTEAIAGEDARQALVAVAFLHESGWGPQQIATELVDDLRQAFLVALAPELCAAAGTDRERLTDQAGRLGLARVVRAIETLGRAQVDMRDAPDPRAVLEVTLIRLARPELDDSTAALLDRVAHLEQAVAGGALAAVRATTQHSPSDRPEPPEPRGSAQGRSGRSGPAAGPDGHAAEAGGHAAEAGGHAAEAGGHAAGEGDADGAPMNALSASGPAQTSTRSTGRSAPAALEERPGLGAMRRQRAEARSVEAEAETRSQAEAEARPEVGLESTRARATTVGAQPAESAQPAAPAAPAALAEPAQPAQPAAPAEPAEPAQPAAPAESAAPADVSPTGSAQLHTPGAAATQAAGRPALPGDGPAPDRDRIVEAWGDHVLRGLPARAKALFSAGRFVSVEGNTATYALPNAAHRERCEEVRGLVEEAIGAHFGTSISLALAVDEAGAPSATGAGANAGTGRMSVDDENVEIDPVQPSGSPESVATARLLEAFPGAQEV